VGHPTMRIVLLLHSFMLILSGALPLLDPFLALYCIVLDGMTSIGERRN
jgi:hypothetical protein